MLLRLNYNVPVDPVTPENPIIQGQCLHMVHPFMGYHENLWGICQHIFLTGTGRVLEARDCLDTYQGRYTRFTPFLQQENEYILCSSVGKFPTQFDGLWGKERGCLLRRCPLMDTVKPGALLMDPVGNSNDTIVKN